MKKKLIALLMLGLTCSAFSGDEYATCRERLKMLPGLLRLYTFEEGYGGEVANHVMLDQGRTALSGGPLGSLTIPYITHYNTNPLSPDLGRLPVQYRNPEWTDGRIPGKAALTTGTAPNGLYRGGINGAEFAVGLTLAGWIRLHDNRPVSLVSVGSGHKDGFLLATVPGKSGPALTFRLGGPDAVHRATLNGGVLIPKVYHHVAATFDGRTMKLYLDGQPVGEQPFTGKIVSAKPRHDIMTARPFIEMETVFLRIGRAMPPFQNGRADFDELAIFDRALAASDLARIAALARPAGTRTEQIAEFERLASNKARLAAIRMTLPEDSSGYFRSDAPIPATLEIPATAGLVGNHQVRFDLTTLAGHPLKRFERAVTPGAPAITESLTFPACGVYWVDMTLLDAAGHTIKRLATPYSVAVAPPKPVRLSPTNPVGLWACYDEFSYDTPLRRMKYWNHKSFLPDYQRLKKIVPELRYTLFFYWKLDGSDKSRQWNAGILEDALKTLPDAPGLDALEMTSEPHNFKPANYVAVLKQTVPAFRKALPDIKIVPPGAAPTGIPLIEGIMKAGGAQYVDGLSFHPYNISPIPNFYTSKVNHELKAIAERDPERPLEIWNSECMVKPLPRRWNRAMTETDALAAKFPIAPDNGYGFRCFGFSRAPEETSAAMQVQHILCDLAFGYKRYIICQTPGIDGNPSAPGVAFAALAGQVLNGADTIRNLPLSDLDNFCALIDTDKGKVTAALFAIRPAMVRLLAAPNTAYRTMDLYGNLGTIQSDNDGMLNVEVGLAARYIFALPKTVRESSMLALSFSENSGADQGITGSLVVSNPGKTPFEGTVRPQPLSGAEITPVEHPVTLAPGQSVTVPVAIAPVNLKRRDYLAAFELLDRDGSPAGRVQQMFASPGALRKIYRVAQEIPLDGDETKYAEFPEYVCNSAADVILGKPNYAEPWIPQWENPDDLSFTVRLGWRKSGAIHFLLKVRDNHLQPAPVAKLMRAFQYDCLELFFDSRKQRHQGTTISTGADQAIVVPAVGDQAEACQRWFASQSRGPRINVECVGKRTADGYLIEGKITPAEPASFRIAAGSQFRMDFTVDDTDEPAKALRKSALALDGDASNSISPQLWGRYELVNTMVTEK
jgi:hypothetical protein